VVVVLLLWRLRWLMPMLLLPLPLVPVRELLLI
jgi:hypothetical protein